MTDDVGTSTRLRANTIALLLFLAAVPMCGLTALWLSLRPPPASPHALQVDRLWNWVSGTLAVALILFHGGLISFIWRSRCDLQTEHSPASESREVWWIMVPLAVLTMVYVFEAFSLGPSIWKQHEGISPDTNAANQAHQIEVVGKQFEWLIRLPGRDGKFGTTRPELIHASRNPRGLDRRDSSARDDMIFRGILRLPQGIPVQLRLRSLDVQHAMSLPEFRIRRDLIPGRVTRAECIPTRIGDFEMVCSELCGPGHYKMQGRVLVMSSSDFADWFSKQQGWFE